jgi:hypothetical protein
MIQFFLELLQVAGGYLNIFKCACFTVFHHWTVGWATFLCNHDSHPNLKISHKYSGDTKHIAHQNTNEAHHALGWMMKIDDKSTAQFIALKAKSKFFSGGIKHHRMERYDTTTAYNVCYLVIIGYTLAATRL